MGEESFLERQEENISIHIFEVSAAMMGICLAAAGILNISESLKKIETIGNELITVNSILFLLSCFFSYMAIRTKSRKRRYGLERIADVFFLGGLLLVAGVCLLVAWEFI